MPFRKDRSTNGERMPVTTPPISDVKDTFVRNVTSRTQNVDVAGDQSSKSSAQSITARPEMSTIIFITKGRYTNT
jgi:hypothetical protein